MKTKSQRKLGLQAAAAALVMVAGASASAQVVVQPTDIMTFVSESTGEDGDFKPTATVVTFDPSQIARVNGTGSGMLDPERDNIFHFKDIDIPSGTTVKMSARWTNGPIYWLAMGTVKIAGRIELDGENGVNHQLSGTARRSVIPGPGGFPGGLGVHYAQGWTDQPTPGYGPGGGKIPGSPGWGSHTGQGGKATVGKYLVPLIGGSGGGGTNYDTPFEWTGPGGGAGGGAILISSTKWIYVSGAISAAGGTGGRWRQNGNCVAGGSGAGGSIRLVANTLEGPGTLFVQNGGSGCWDTSGDNGRIRLEAYQQRWNYSIPYGSYSTGSPIKSLVPSGAPPSIVVTEVAGVAFSNPKGEFTAADVTINASGEVEFKVRAQGVPLTRKNASSGLIEDTTAEVHLFSLEGPDKVIVTDALKAVPEAAGASTAKATVDSLPPGFTRGLVRVRW